MNRTKTKAVAHTQNFRAGLSFLAVMILVVGCCGLSGCAGLVGGKTSSNPGPTPLSISGTSAGSVTTTGAAISWQTNAPATSQVEYGATTTYGTMSALDNAMVSAHQESLTSLKAGTLYHYRVHSNDATSGSAVSNDATFTTLSAPDTTPPTVSVTSPAANATLSGVANLTATASDNVGVTSVQFKVDGANTGAVLANAPYSYLLDTTTLSNGNHILTAVAGDAAGNTATSAGVAIKVNNSTPDTTPPTVSITAPANGASVLGTVNVTANASDNVSVASVQFQVDGANLGSPLVSSPYGFSWDTTKSSNGSHSLRAVAKDGAGNSATSTAVTVTVNNNTPPDTTPPTVSITSPVNGASISGTITISASASDNVGVASVQFQLDGANLGSLDTASPYSTVWNTVSASNGSHTLRAIAKDAAGNSGTSAAVTLTVSNTPSDTTPPSTPTGLTATAVSSSQINLLWNASTDNVGVAGYKVFRGGTQIATSGSASFQDTNLAASTTYTYTTQAFDAAGNNSAQSASASATTQVSSGGGGIPPGLGWFEAPNTKLTSVCPPANFGGTSYDFPSHCYQVVGAWSGAIADTSRNRLVVWGGGHVDYYGNELYSFDLNTLQMTRLNDPSTPVASSCILSMSDGKPNARHNYGSLVYVAHLDMMFATNGVVACPSGGGGKDTWVLNLSNLQWTRKADSPENCTSGVCYAAYDPNSKLVFIDDRNSLYTYKVETDTWSSVGNSASDNLHFSAVIDPVKKQFVKIGGGAVVTADISNPGNVTEVDRGTPSGCSALQNSESPGLSYDSVLGKIVGWPSIGSANTVYIYDSTSNSCTAQTYSGGPPDSCHDPSGGCPNTDGTFGRFAYFPTYGVHVALNDANFNVRTLRLTPASGGGTPAAPVISNVATSGLSPSGATVGWTTDVASTSQVEYGTTTAYGTLTTLNSTMVSSHSVALSGLSAGTLYHYRVHSRGSNNVEAVGSDFTFATNSGTGGTLSVSITSPTNGATVSGTIAVLGSATASAGVAGVQFALDGTNVGAQVTSSPYQMSLNTTSLSNGTHTLMATVKDTGGATASSPTITVTVSNATGTGIPFGDCSSEGGLKGRTDILYCEPWENSTWWQGKGFLSSASIVDPIQAVQSDFDHTSIVSTGCISGNCLQVEFRKGELGSLSVQWPLAKAGLAPESLYLRYYIKLSSNWNPNQFDANGVEQGTGGKFPGLADIRDSADPGGQCGNGGNPSDGIHCWSMRADYRDCLNACLNTPGATTRYGSYIYFPGQEGPTGDNAEWDKYTWGQSAGLFTGNCQQDWSNTRCGFNDTADFVNNKWYAVEMYVKMNTPGFQDGIIRGWVNGVLGYEKTNMQFRLVGNDNLHVRTVWLNLFKGGTTGNGDNMQVWLDQMVVATNPIGLWTP